MSKNGITDEFKTVNVTLEQVFACLENTDPKTGKTWLQSCLEKGWSTEDILRPLSYGNYEVEQQGRGTRQCGRT